MQPIARPAGRGGILTAGLAAAVVMLLLLLSAAPAALAVPVRPAVTIAPATNSTQQWAYGTHANFSLNLSGSNGNSFQVTGWAAYHVILTQTNTSASDFMLTSHRTFGFAYTATGKFCLNPLNCASGGHVTLDLYVRALESDWSFANFTRNGSVVANGSTVPALAVINETDGSATHYVEFANYSAPVNGHTYKVQNSVRVGLNTSAQIAFAPAFGLVPTTLAPGLNWTSQSNFTASGSASGSLFAQHVAWNGASTNLSTNFSPSFSRNGTIAMSGQDLATITLANGQTVPVLLLTVGGPFTAREGIMFVPRSADLMGAGTSAYSGNTSGDVKAGTLVVDWAGGAIGRLGLTASRSGMTPAPSPAAGLQFAPATAPATSAGIGTAVGIATPAPPMTATSFQAQPETVAAAESGDQCIVAGNCTPSGSTPNNPARGLLGPIVLVSAVVVLAGLLAALVVSRRQTPKPPASSTPPYPPAGVTTFNPPAASPRSPTGAPPPEQDPLSHLW